MARTESEPPPPTLRTPPASTTKPATRILAVGGDNAGAKPASTATPTPGVKGSAAAPSTPYASRPASSTTRQRGRCWGGWPTVGTPQWCALDDDDPAKLAALFDAAQHWGLRIEACQQAYSDASSEISA